MFTRQNFDKNTKLVLKRRGGGALVDLFFYFIYIHIKLSCQLIFFQLYFFFFYFLENSQYVAVPGKPSQLQLKALNET